MSDPNPYEAPEAEVSDPHAESMEDVQGLISGQRLVIFAILLNIVANGIPMGAPEMALAAVPVALIALVMSIIGIVRMSSNLGHNVVVTFIYCLLMFVPCFNILILALINQRVTERIRAAGFEVGFFGAKT